MIFQHESGVNFPVLDAEVVNFYLVSSPVSHYGSCGLKVCFDSMMDEHTKAQST